MEVLFTDIDGDGEREILVENDYLRAVLRYPEKLGYAFYKGRFTWGGRLQSLEYKPTGREFLLPTMVDLEEIKLAASRIDLWTTVLAVFGRLAQETIETILESTG